MEFNLSEKIIQLDKDGSNWDFLHKQDIKEFIKLLKCWDKNKLMGKDCIVILKSDFDKLAGEALV